MRDRVRDNEFSEDHRPLAYFISIRCYGTWLPAPREGLVVLDRARSASPTTSRVALLHGDLMAGRPDYDINLFAALRSLIMGARQLVLLARVAPPLRITRTF